MLSSTEVSKTDLLKASGFIKVRRSFEMDVTENELIVQPNQTKVQLAVATADSPEFFECQKFVFEHYATEHEQMSQLTASLEEFSKGIPTIFWYTRSNGKIEHVAAIEDNEIAYIYSDNKAAFTAFAQAVVTKLFAENEAIFFVADDVSWAATTLKNLFSPQPTESFDTWVFNGR